MYTLAIDKWEVSVASKEDEEEKALFVEVNLELRRFYDLICGSFDHVKNKALGLMIGEVAIATFLFSGFDLKTDGTNPIYGYVMLGIGLALLLFAFAMYLTVIATAQWQFPTERHDMRNPTERFKGSSLEYQKYLHSEYLEKIGYCNKLSSTRASRFMYGTYSLTVGIVIVILIKYGGGA